MSLIDKINKAKLPRHVAIIMDGNGRWAKQHGMMRSMGHQSGVGTVRQVTEVASELGIGYLTLYTFSTENWNRPQDEVDALMHLIVISIEQQTPDLIKNNVRLTMIGDTARLPQSARERLEGCMQATSHCTGLVLCLALSYSSRWEIARACRQIVQLAASGKLDPATIGEDTVAAHLATAGMPDPDLLIRTGGELRLSNYLMWQTAYSELYFTSVYWPDFGKEEFLKAIIDYQARERRYGKTSEQINNTTQNDEQN